MSAVEPEGIRKAVQAGERMLERAARSQHDDWSKADWNQHNSDFVLFTLYELPALVAAARDYLAEVGVTRGREDG